MIFKYLFPYDSFVIDSPLAAQEARTRLAAVMKPRTYFRLSSPDAGELEGVMTVQGFRVNRILRGRNSFNAQAIGEIEPAPGGCRIRVHMRMMLLIYAFVLFWLSGVIGIGGVGFSQARAYLATGQGDLTMLAMPVGMVCFLLVICNIGFWTSAAKLKASLRTLFQAR